MPDRIWNTLPWLALAAALAYCGVHWQGKVLPQSVGLKQAGESRAFLDFDCYWGASQLLDAGESVYAPITNPGSCGAGRIPEYVYPPTLALALSALAPLGHCQAEWLWFGANVLMCLATVPLLIGALGLPRTPLMLAATLFLVLAPMATLEDLSLGQVNFQVLGLLLGVAWLLRLRKVPAAAVLLGLAFAVKLIPAVVGLAFVRNRRSVFWPVLAGAGILLVVFWVAPADTPATFVAAVQTKATENLGASTNASLLAWAVRAFDLGPDGARLAVKINTLLVLGLAGLAWVWARGRLDDIWFVTALMALAVAITPLYEVHHQVLLYPALLALLHDAATTGRWPSRVARITGLLVLGILTNSRGLVPLHAAHDPLTHLAVKPAGLALAVLIGWLLLNLKNGRDTAPQMFALDRKLSRLGDM